MSRPIRPALRSAGPWRRSLAAALIAALLVCQVPTPALAEMADAAASSAAVAQQQSAVDAVASGAGQDAAAETTEGAAGDATSEVGGAADPATESVGDGALGSDPADTDTPQGGTAAAEDPAAADAVDDGGSPSASDEAAAAADGRDQAVTVSVAVVGPGADGVTARWAGAEALTLDAGPTAADASEALFEQAGLAADTGVGAYGWFLNSITSPYTGEQLGWDEATGRYWQLFVDGKPSETGAGGIDLADGMAVTWAYSAFGDGVPEVDALEVSVSVIGPDANGADVRWADAALKLDAGSTAADASEALFEQAGLAADTGIGSYGWFLNSITSPYTGEALGWDQPTGRYWQLFVNGESSDTGAGGVVLSAGDTVCWAYSAYGDGVPETSPIVPDPDAERPDWESAWPGYGSSVPEGAGLPTGAVSESWVSQMKDPSDWATNVSDPIVAGGRVFVAVGSELRQLDPATGEVLCRGALAAPIDSIARMVYTDGVVVVPLSGGRLQALTADALTTVWVTPALAAGVAGAQQSLSSLTVGDGCVYFGTADADWSTTYGGYLVCVDTSTGKVLWTQQNKEAGYYWAGAVRVGGFLAIGDDAGAVCVLDATTGAAVSSLSVGARVRSTLVAGADGSTVYAVTYDGVLHRLAVGQDGSIVQTGSVKFAKSSVGTPTLVGGKLYVGGQSEEYVQVNKYTKAYLGVMAVIDAETLSVERAVSTVDGAPLMGDKSSADVMGAPVVATRDGETYIYFTANCRPGGVYRYRVGAASAELVYTPSEMNQNFCMASIVVGDDGSLYYVNDSGALFALAGDGVLVPEVPETPETPEDPDNPSTPPAGENHDGGKHRAGGAVPAGKKPVAAQAASKSGETKRDAADEKGMSADEVSEDASGARKASRAGVAVEGSVAASGMNPLAVAGVVAGIAGLVLVGAYMAIVRKRG